LFNHLKTQHSFVFADPKQPRIAEVLVEKPFSQDRLDQYLLEWIVKDDQPFTQLQSKDFMSWTQISEQTPNLRSRIWVC
jgi:hypothetical protein